MKSEDVACLIYIIVAAVTITLSVLIVRWTVNSDLPLWLKIFILR